MDVEVRRGLEKVFVSGQELYFRGNPNQERDEGHLTFMGLRELAAKDFFETRSHLFGISRYLGFRVDKYLSGSDLAGRAEEMYSLFGHKLEGENPLVLEGVDVPRFSS